MNCPTCGNQIRKRKVFVGNVGPKCAPVYNKEPYCSYCEWKGTTGAGKELRDIIKEYNHGR